MTLILQKAYIHLKNGFLMEASYKTAFVMMLFNTVFGLFIYYFISKMLGSAAQPYLLPYGGDYFAFVLIGMAFSNYARASVNSLPGIVRAKQTFGSLEVELSTPTRFSTILFCSTLWTYLYTTVQVAIVLLFGFLLFGFKVGGMDYFGVIAVIGLTISALIGVGMISSGIILVIKKGDPIGNLFSLTSDIVSGVFIPLAVMPYWLQMFSRLFPLTYSLDALRRIIIKGETLAGVKPDLIALAGFTLIFLPLGLLILEQSMKKAKKDGSLAEY
jgi:ABC-2 type transport system permease protein